MGANYEACPLSSCYVLSLNSQSLQFVLRHSQSMLGEDCEECRLSPQLLKSSEIMVYIFMLESILLYCH
jgi:hypothetical protein